MQVSVETLDGLERRMTVRIPAEKVDQEVESRLKDLVRQVKIDGFRPGKVPFKVVKRMYGPRIRQDVVNEKLEQSFRQALEQEKLRPANAPQIEPLGEKEIGYSAVFEVFPEFQVAGVDGIPVTRPVAEVSEADIDRMLETLREQRLEWHEVERPAQAGDRLTLSFEGKIDGETFPGGKAESTQMVLGEGRLLPAFEENLQGLSKGDEKTFDLTFPDDYQSQELAGKTATFQVQAEAVAESELPSVDDAFAAAYGLEDATVAGLRKALRETMERQLQDGIKAGIKRQVMDKLLASNNDVPIPQAMLKEEIDGLARQAGIVQQDNEKEGGETAGLKQQMFGEQARRRVALGLIVSNLVEAQGIKIDSSRVQANLEMAINNHPQLNPETVMQMYRDNPEAMEGIRSMALEDQVVDWLLERASIEDEPSTFDAIMRPEHATHDHDHDASPEQPAAEE